MRLCTVQTEMHLGELNEFAKQTEHKIAFKIAILDKCADWNKQTARNSAREGIEVDNVICVYLS